MRRYLRHLKWLVVTVTLAAVCTPAYSLDPLTLILLRLLRDKLVTTGVENAVERLPGPRVSPSAAPTVASPALPLGMDDANLRRLIDEGFLHLTQTQRNEVYASTRRILLDPKNADEAPALIADLALKASAVRQVHEALNQLSDARKRRIALEAREEYERLPPADREGLASALRARMVPLPDDLTRLILIEFDAVRALAQAADAANTTSTAATVATKAPGAVPQQQP